MTATLQREHWNGLPLRWQSMKKFSMALLLLLGTAVCAETQPAVHFGAGGTWLDAKHERGPGASVLAPTVLASIAAKDSAFGVEAEFKLPRTHVAEVAGSNRIQSYVIRFDRRDAVVSALGRVGLDRHRKVSAAVLFGGSWITSTSTRTVYPPPGARVDDSLSGTRFHWSAGFDVVVRLGHVRVLLPQFRCHLPFGSDPELRLSVGGAVTWSPTSS